MIPADPAIVAKAERLRTAVMRHRSLMVAYSGGVDSALVLKVAHDALGDRATGVTADSPALPREELAAARRIADAIGARHIVVATHEIDDADYAANPPDRCYHCKTSLYRALAAVARREGVRHLANGTNLDDLGDYRPGLLAADEFEVVQPLVDAELGKADVRALARALGVEVWNKPASPCLASRIPYGTPVTRERLATIERAESFVRGLGFSEVRVRHFGATARVEVPHRDLASLRRQTGELRGALHALGFARVETVEFRSGALNVTLGAMPGENPRESGT